MAPSEPLSYDEIHGIQKRERASRALAKVPHDFYERLAGYVADAKAGLEEESKKGPSPRLVLLQGQFRNLQEMAREIMLLRLRKVTELAFSAVETGALSDRTLTPEESGFAKQVQALVETTRQSLVREGAAPPPPAPPPSPRIEAPHSAPAEKQPPKAAHEKAPPTPQAAPAVVLRILDDIPPFEGEGNHVYRLKREDVITLPRDIAQILLRRKKAVELQVPP